MAKLQIMLLGCGKMGSAMLKGWLADTSLDAQFIIIEPFADHLGWARGISRWRSIVIAKRPLPPGHR